MDEFPTCSAMTTGPAVSLLVLILFIRNWNHFNCSLKSAHLAFGSGEKERIPHQMEKQTINLEGEILG